MKTSNNNLLLFALITSFAMATSANAEEALGTEAQRSLEPSHQNSQGFESGQHPQYAKVPAVRRAIANRVQSMSPEERQAAREKFENMSTEERQAVRAELQDRVQGRVQSQIEERRQQGDPLQTL